MYEVLDASDELRVFDCNEAAQITPFVDSITSLHRGFEMVLIVEKETVFRKIVETKFQHKHKCLLVTVPYTAALHNTTASHDIQQPAHICAER